MSGTMASVGGVRGTRSVCWDICMHPPCTDHLWRDVGHTPIPLTPSMQNRKGSALSEFLSPFERWCCVNRRIGSCLQVKQSKKIRQSFLLCKSVSSCPSPFPPPQGQEETPVAALPVCVWSPRPVPLLVQDFQVHFLPWGRG